MIPTEEQLAELKRAELDILRVFVDVCRKLNLRYYLLGGTLLGAVRHQGFIPWDDDIDVGMLRADYEIFLEKAQALLPENLFLQTVFTDPDYRMCFAKIRNSNTTFVETAANTLRINHGVFIDIFPLDYYPENEQEQKRLALRKKLYNRRSLCGMNLGTSGPKQKVKDMLLRAAYPSLEQVIRKRERLYKGVSPSGLVANHGGAWGKKEIVPAQWYGEGAPLLFEGLQVNGPAEYDKWLTQVYGDYMQLPPVEKRVGHHYTDVIDMTKSYREYMEE